jgi:hypothetical protein
VSDDPIATGLRVAKVKWLIGINFVLTIMLFVKGLIS